MPLQVIQISLRSSKANVGWCWIIRGWQSLFSIQQHIHAATHIHTHTHAPQCLMWRAIAVDYGCPTRFQISRAEERGVGVGGAREKNLSSSNKKNIKK